MAGVPAASQQVGRAKEVTMRKLTLPLVSVLLLLLVGFGLSQVARGQGSGEQVVTREV